MNRRILIVDDSVDLLESLKKLLELYDYEVHTASSGQEALDNLSEHNYDLILCDVKMPYIDGLELLRRIKFTVNIHIPVVFMTGEITVETALESIRLGITDFIRKPFSDYQIIKTVTGQIAKTNRDEHFQNYHHYLVGTHYCFEFTANDYVNFNITDFLISRLLTLKDIAPSVCNELSLCLEEMISNAFIHGTFKIGSIYKKLDYEKYSALIHRLLGKKEINNAKVMVNITYHRRSKKISVTVTDDGEGFDYRKHEINPNSVFQGLSLIKVLTDRVGFHNKGRTIRIEKSIEKRNGTAKKVFYG
jgi:CheY-like chemotaxis protein